MVRLYDLVDRLAPVNMPVLITGETGCGKELIATAIHVRSERAAKPLISVNCAALHDMLAESELFGHEKGAFSGAVATRVGLIEAASESTLFLDEVGELTPSVQAKLLRVLELHRLTRAGDTREREVDVRIVAATNRDLETDVRAGICTSGCRPRRFICRRFGNARASCRSWRARFSKMPADAADAS
jgi:transcriptional regulator with GAF, ATPase, and Fis domain